MEPRDAGPDGPPGPTFSDVSDVIHATYWLIVFASRPLLATLTRPPAPGHLAALLDVFAAYAARGARHHEEEFEPVPWEERAPLARKLRALLEAWTPTDPSDEICQTARALLHADGHAEPEGGWDAFSWDGPGPIEDSLLWPEGVPAVLREQDASSAPVRALTIEELHGPKRPRRSDQGHVEIVYADIWNEVAFWVQKVVRSEDGNAPRDADFGDISSTVIWLMVLASPPLYRTLARTPERDHLLRLLDKLIAYAARGEHITSVKTFRRRDLRLDQREALARKLRALIEGWTPPALPGLPGGITDAARELVEAEGIRPPDGGWDALAHDRPGLLEDILLWPEGIPAMRGASASNEGGAGPAP